MFSLQTRLAISALCCCLLSQPATSVPSDALLASCKAAIETTTRQNVFDQGYCLGMATAFHYLGETLREGLKICVPEGVSHNQILRIVVKYLDDHPGQLHGNLEAMMFEALRVEWGC